ncbi:UNVERIFIED_CONTAM: hypothetical protein Sradi_2158600 [Sesamum radiatum]|uniref:Uncharacterized protein n=1 Tax=Sesamum radiatum TaxID=300843 RepID=A0AAW2T096_SESRA
MADPLLHHSATMDRLSSVDGLEDLLREVLDECSTQGKLQMIVCVMTREDPGYKYLKVGL